MLIKSAEYVTSAVKPSQYPVETLPEIAFVGKSNVGKSSLINTLANRRHLARISSTPGRTRMINFFNINNALTFVDLPGYGFARVPEAVRKKWAHMIETYLSGRKNLKAVVVVLDIRRHPGPGERELFHWLDYHHLAPIVVVTKADKLSRPRQQKQLQSIVPALPVEAEDVILFSAKTRLGRDTLWEAILGKVDALNS